MQDPEVPPSDALRFRARLHTRWSDEDNQGVLNNAVVLTLLEEARHAYFGQLGLLDSNRFPFLLSRCNVRFVATGRGGVDVEVELATVQLGTSSFRQVYRVRSLEDGAVWAEAEALLVCYDPRSGRSSAMSPAFRAAIAGYEGLA
jgi:acyl-CoA thioester hydrolase